ncbi:Phage protein [Pseudomonas soli]
MMCLMVYRNTYIASGIFRGLEFAINGASPVITGLGVNIGAAGRCKERISCAENEQRSVVKLLEYHNMVFS